MVPSASERQLVPSDAPNTAPVDDRQIAYAEYGDHSGDPVVFLHGSPGSRHLGRLLDESATQLGVRLLTPDRPGMGRSDPPPVGLDDWPTIVETLLDRIDVDRSGIVGFSGGGPFALACHNLDRVDSIAVVSSAGPPEIGGAGKTQAMLGTLSRHTPGLVSVLMRLQGWILDRGDPERFLDLVATDRPATDTLSTDEIARLVRADMREAVSQGHGGVVTELGVLSNPWPFDLGDVSVPVTVVHGQRDTNVDYETGKKLGRRVPDATFVSMDTGHLGTLCRARIDVLRSVTV